MVSGADLQLRGQQATKEEGVVFELLALCSLASPAQLKNALHATPGVCCVFAYSLVLLTVL